MRQTNHTARCSHGDDDGTHSAVDLVKTRTSFGLALVLVIAATGITACGGSAPSPTSAVQTAGDLSGVRIEVHEAPG